MKTKYVFHSLLTGFTFVLFSLPLAAGPRTFIHIHDISMNTSLSGNGFGAVNHPSAGIGFGRRLVVSAGPVFRAGDNSNNGMRADLHYALMREEESWYGHSSIYSLISFTHFSDQGLGRAAVRQEENTLCPAAREQVPHFADLRYSGEEYAAGLGFSYRFDFGLFIRSEAGIAYYQTKQKSPLPVPTYRCDNALVLKLGCGIGWAFSR
ncbi:MAG TPA: hypothetical protein VFU15_09690 [Bacteroidia bacterium]|nr:hypothetical protein [Bacteroidia bacterium]